MNDMDKERWGELSLIKKLKACKAYGDRKSYISDHTLQDHVICSAQSS